MNSNETKIIAFAGKGGVGKTSLAALTVRLLAEAKPEAKVLAIDADPAIGLATALGIEVTETLDDIRKKFIEEAEKGNSKGAMEILQEAHYDITDAMVEGKVPAGRFGDESQTAEAAGEAGGFVFLAIGRPEGAGCYCKINSFLKDIIGELAASFDYVVIDGEAGIEQVNRRVMEKVTHLVLVSDPSRKGLNVIETIKDVAEKLCMCQHYGAIINRVKSEAIQEKIKTDTIPIAGFLPEDDDLALLDIEGASLLDLSSESKTLTALSNALGAMNIL